jgi:hypothetical protein
MSWRFCDPRPDRFSKPVRSIILRFAFVGVERGRPDQQSGRYFVGLGGSRSTPKKAKNSLNKNLRKSVRSAFRLRSICGICVP